MNKAELCRLCANWATCTNSEKLFELSQRKLLQQVKDITGLQLKNTTELPQLICTKCRDQTRQAHQFRELCIRAQQHFATEKYRNPIAKPSNTENRALKDDNDFAYDSCMETAEVVDSNEKCSIKALQSEEEEQKQQKTHNAVIKQIIKAEKLNSADNAAAKQIYFAEVDTLVAEQPQKYSDTSADDSKTTTKICKFKRKAKSNLICDQCGRHFKCRSNFVIHMRRHNGIKPFQCELCPEKFNANWDLKRHVRNHTGELPYPCRYCERRFREVSSRIRHERNHTNVRPFACSQCDKSFTQSQALKNHMLTHTGERAFECKMCKVFFKRKTHLVTHYRSLMHKHLEQQQLSVGTTTTAGATSILECDISQQCL